MSVTNAIKLALNGQVHDEELVAGLLDKTKLELDESGALKGLDDQVKVLQESKAFCLSKTIRHRQDLKEQVLPMAWMVKAAKAAMTETLVNESPISRKAMKA
ncbi:phage scaffolding protein [Paenibacillus larvae]|nr:phage scaffolding protein [Paenibacillus larvae]